MEKTAVMSDNGNRDAVQWGPEIAIVNGKPDWLEPNERVSMTGGHDRFPARQWIFDGSLPSFRVRADHPHYKQAPVRTTDEQLTHYAERCKALVEKMAKYGSHDPDGHSYDEDARAIVASMVEVDGDLVEARGIVCDCVPSWNEDHREQCTDGKFDGNLFVVIALAAIRRGRALERGE